MELGLIKLKSDRTWGSFNELLKTDKDALDIERSVKTQCINRQLIKEKQLTCSIRF
jgi:hypothetical protein